MRSIRPSARAHRNDLVVEAGETALVARDQLGIERSLPIAGNPNVELRTFRQNALLRIAIAVVGLALGGPAVKVIVEFGVQNPLGQRLLQLIE
jgi:hypothetical protein